jgi:hypothetical protein
MKTTLLLLTLLHFFQLAGQTPPTTNLPLPEIKELEYILIPSDLERIFPPNTCQKGLIGLLKNYDRKLENMGGYEVYLVKQSCTFSEEFCLCFETTAQGEFEFLILFDPKTKKAKALLVWYEFLSDSEVYLMQFKIQHDVIKLTGSGFTEGEGGKADALSKNTFKVKVLKNGGIKVLIKEEK